MRRSAGIRKMHRAAAACLCAVLLLGAAGCGKSESKGSPVGKQAPGVSDVLEAGMAKADSAAQAVSVSTSADSAVQSVSAPASADSASQATSAQSSAESTAETVSAPAPAEGVDVDLTVMSSMMVYSEVYNMVVAPEDYIGKTVKMRGNFDFYHDEKKDVYYFACLIPDATACCAQGIEFVPTGNYVYPDDFPEKGEEVTVTGVFDTYELNDSVYTTLREASFN